MDADMDWFDGGCPRGTVYVGVDCAGDLAVDAMKHILGIVMIAAYGYLIAVIIAG